MNKEKKKRSSQAIKNTEDSNRVRSLLHDKPGDLLLNISSASNMINSWFKALGLEGIHGARSLHKTREYNYMNRLSHARNNNLLDSADLFKPIKTPTAQEIIYKELYKARISCRIPPGTKLTATEISRAFLLSPLSNSNPCRL